LMGTTLRYPYEIRDAKDYFDDIPNIKIAPDMLKLAEHIVETKEADFDPSKFADHYEEAVVEMLKKKQAGATILRGKADEPPPNVINLMDALRRSVAADKNPKKAAANKGRKRVEGQGEMLLPIAGKKAKEVAKPAARPSARQKKTG
jgi:DNA end-binding protein Ku